MPSRQNEAVEVFASGAREGANAKTVPIPYHRGVMVVVDVTATTGDGTEDLAVRIQVADPVTGKKLQLVSDSFDNGGTGTRWYLIYPGVADTGTVFDAIEEVPVGREVEVELESLQGGAGTVSHTYSVGLHKLL